MPLPSKIPAQVIVSLIITLILAVAATMGVQQILKWRQGAQQNEDRGRTMESARRIGGIGDDSAQARGEADQGQAAARDTFNRQIREDRRNEPATAARDDSDVPVSRLRAFKNRRLERERLARERLERAGVEREEGPGSEVPPVR